MFSVALLFNLQFSSFVIPLNYISVAAQTFPTTIFDYLLDILWNEGLVKIREEKIFNALYVGWLLPRERLPVGFESFLFEHLLFIHFFMYFVFVQFPLYLSKAY